MSRRDKCPGWCDYRKQAPHSGRHAHHVGEVMLSKPEAAYVVAVTVESVGKTPAPVVTIGGRYTSYAAAVMTWSEAERLSSILADAKRRYG